MTPAAVNYPTITSPVTPSIQNSDLTLAMTPAAVNHPTITSPVTMLTQNSNPTLLMTPPSPTMNLSAFMKDMKVCDKPSLY